MKKVLLICLLINSYFLIFTSHNANAKKHCHSEEKDALMKDKYRLCTHRLWSLECGILSVLHSNDPWGVRWTKKSSCCKIGGTYVRKNAFYLKNIVSPKNKKCIFGNKKNKTT